MARSQEGSREHIDAAVERFKTHCLLSDGSLLFGDREVWTLDLLDDLRRRLVEGYIPGTDRNFEEKLSEQLEGAPETSRLAAETLVVYSLFVSSILSPWWKRELVNRALGAGGVNPSEVDHDSEAWKALDQWIGSPGRRYNYKRPDELAYLIDFARALKGLALSERERLLNGADPLPFQKWLDGLELRPAQLRHILLHLLWPERYERIASGQDKSAVVRFYGPIVPDAPEDEDQHLLGIRAKLAELAWTPSPR